MTKRRLYAQLAAALTWLVWCVTVTAQPRQVDPPCGACLVITIEAGQSLLIPEELNGLTVLVRAAGPPAPAVRAALAEIRRRGGRSGLALVPRDSDAASIDRLAFELKQVLTEYRAAAGAAAVIAVVTSAGLKQSLLDRDIGAYVDVFLQPVTGHDVSAALDLTRRGEGDVAVAAPADALAARSFLAEAVRVASVLPEGLVPLPGSTVHCGSVASEVFLDPRTRQQVAVVRCGVGSDVRVTPPREILERVEISGGSAVLRMAAPAGERFAEDVQVRAGRRYSVEEVIARHQAAVRRQASLASRVISSGTLTLTFEAPGFPAPVTISAATVIYVDRDRTDLEQRSIRVNGMEFRGGRVPRLPILEPERVASPPLAISLTDQYRYRLGEDDTVQGIRCYVVSFEPTGKGPLFAGRAWIAMDSFGMVKVAAAQTGLRGAIVSSEQQDEFRQVRDGVWLLARSNVRQVYEGAAHRTPIHRRLTLDEHLVDPPDFDARRDGAYASSSVMLRDTPQGYRYLRRERPREGGRPTIVEVTKAASRVRTLAAGVIIDPNISRPLPFAGISYVDFNLLGTGSQLNAFFGGAYGQLAFSVPSILKSRWQVAGRAFGIATSYNDRSFRNGREIYDEAVRQRPAQASVWLLRPLTPLISVRVGYDLDYTRLRAAPETTPAFIVPADQVVHGARFALEGQRDGWTASLWWNAARRAGWRAWGSGGEYEPRHADFQRFGLTVGKSTAWSPRVVTRVDAQWMDGRDLDRFSRYSFGTFDNRLRGYPSALVRYDRGGVLRGALAWSAAKFVRIDGFVDTAAVRDPGFGPGLRNYTGIGAAAEAPAPFGLLTAVEWGYGFRGVNSNGDRGTHVIRVSAFKVF